MLCEKPLTTTADRVDYCADAGATLMEAFMFMYQFHLRTERAREVAAEELGDVHSVDATFTFRLPGPPDIRLDANLGGALFDVGSYAVSAACGFLGEPDRAYARFSDTRDSGVDTDVADLLEYDDGRTARVSAGFDTAHVLPGRGGRRVPRSTRLLRTRGARGDDALRGGRPRGDARDVRALDALRESAAEGAPVDVS